MAIVLMVLGVVSLIGVALLTQSRLDIQFTSSLKSYDKMFNLADGASAISFQDLWRKNRDVGYLPTDSTLGRVTLFSDQTIVGVPEAGKYTAAVELSGASTDPRLSVGWESGYFPEFWRGEGTGMRDQAFESMPSIVHASVTKFRKSGQGN